MYVVVQEYPQYYEDFTAAAVHHKEVQINKRMKWISKMEENDPLRTLICNCLQDEPQRRPATSELNATLIQFSQRIPKSYTDVVHLVSMKHYLLVILSGLSQQDPMTLW